MAACVGCKGTGKAPEWDGSAWVTVTCPMCKGEGVKHGKE